MAKRTKKRTTQETPKEEVIPEIMEGAKAQADGGNGKDPETPVQVDTPESIEKELSPWDKMPEEVEDPAGVFKLAFKEMELAYTQVKMAHMEQTVNVQLTELVRKRDITKNEDQGLIKKMQNQLIRLKEGLEEKHGIVMKCYNYDDETGVFKKKEDTKPKL